MKTLEQRAESFFKHGIPVNFSQKELKQIISYDKDSGEIKWINSKIKNRNGKIAGYVNAYGYRVLMLKGKFYLCHRLAWIYEYGSIQSGMVIDHINGDKLDNRIKNLRMVTERENFNNRTKNRNGNKFGCYYDKQYKKWRSSIIDGGKKVNLGRFATEEEAHQAYISYSKNKLSKVLSKQEKYLLAVEALLDSLSVINSLESMMYENPNVREDCYNKGVVDCKKRFDKIIAKLNAAIGGMNYE